MTSMQLIVLSAVVLAAAVVFARVRLKGKGQAVLESRLKARQIQIQSVVDSLGAALKDPSTSPRQGEAAAQSAVAELRRLNPDGSLDPLIADTEAYFAEWLASRPSA